MLESPGTASTLRLRGSGANRTSSISSSTSSGVAGSHCGLLSLSISSGPHALVEIVGADDAAGERIFGAHFVLEAGAVRAFLHQPERDLARQRALGAERRQLGLRPFALVGLERGDDLLEPVAGEAARDRRQVLGDLRLGRGDAQARRCRRSAAPGSCRPLDQVGEARPAGHNGSQGRGNGIRRRRAGRRSAP